MSTKMITAITVAVLCISVSAQQNSRSGTVRPQTSEPTTTAKKAVTLSGHVIDDGRILVSEDQDQWAVSNPATLATHTGRRVTVKCQLSADQNSIHVLSIKAAETKYVAAHNDSAFRR
jgi:hypothetical protein